MYDEQHAFGMINGYCKRRTFINKKNDINQVDPLEKILSIFKKTGEENFDLDKLDLTSADLIELEPEFDSSPKNYCPKKCYWSLIADPNYEALDAALCFQLEPPSKETILKSTHFNKIILPRCEALNKTYNSCALNAYRGKKRGCVKNLPSECSDLSWIKE